MADKNVDTNLWVWGALDATTITQDGVSLVLSTLISGNGLGVVNHGATAGTSRPTGFAYIQWVGSIEPTNAINGDTWVDTTV